MKVHDSIVGAVILVLGASVAIYARTLVPPRHLPYGPGFFPFLIGIALALVGAGMIVQGVRAGRGVALFTPPEWIASLKTALRFWVLPAAIGFYMVAVGPLGFLATATILLATILIINGISVLRGIGLAVTVALVVNIIFASVLHVPLSWGVLTPISGWFIW